MSKPLVTDWRTVEKKTREMSEKGNRERRTLETIGKEFEAVIYIDRYDGAIQSASGTVTKTGGKWTEKIDIHGLSDSWNEPLEQVGMNISASGTIGVEEAEKRIRIIQATAMLVKDINSTIKNQGV